MSQHILKNTIFLIIKPIYNNKNIKKYLYEFN